MKYIYYDKRSYLPGCITKDTKGKHSDYCGNGWNGFVTAIKCYLWYLGVPARIAFKKWKTK